MDAEGIALEKSASYECASRVWTLQAKSVVSLWLSHEKLEALASS